MLESIVTCCPPATGVTAAILSTLVPPVTVPAVSLYVHVFPTAIGNGTELLETTDVEPPEPPEPLLADLELLLALLLDEPELLDDPELPALQPVRTRPATAASPTPARAEWRTAHA
jgi:hypothetical protein